MTTDHATVTRGVSLPVPCGARPDADDPDPPAWCADDSTCAKDPTRIVEVGGCEIAACGHHADAAAERAADLAGVELVEPALEPSECDHRDPFNRSVEDYDDDHHEQIASERVTEDADGRRLIADGGREMPDPDDLGRCSPAVVRLYPDERLLVADAAVVTEGWLKVTDWGGQEMLYPPENIAEVHKLRTERVEEGELAVRIADDDLRAEARELWTEAADHLDDDRQVVVADD